MCESKVPLISREYYGIPIFGHVQGAVHRSEIACYYLILRMARLLLYNCKYHFKS